MNRNLPYSVELILKHEGGFVHHKDDPGGATNLGVTLATYRRYIDPDGTVEDLKALTIEQATTVYENQYWDAVKADALPPGVDLSVFDMAVNAGPRRAVRLLQRVVGTAQDGIIGPRTIAAAWESADGDVVISSYAEERLKFYRRLRHWPTFGRGWSRRVRETEKAALDLHRAQRHLVEADEDNEIT